MWAELNQYVMDQMWVILAYSQRHKKSGAQALGGVFFWEPQGAPSFGDIYIKK
jgi:hypothetical protein